MSSVSVLRSKVRVPALPEVCVERPALEQRALVFPDAPDRVLIYLSAPAGYGKTTLLSRIAGGFTGRCVWVSLDALDNDPHRLAEHLQAAGRSGSSEAAGAPGASGATGPNDMAGVARTDAHRENEGAPGLRELSRALYTIEELGEAVLLVLDDAHVVQNEAVFEVLRGFIAYRPTNCRVAISTREDLPLPLSTHRLTERLLELRAEDLRAREDEARELLRRMGLQLEEAALRGVLRKTAGWWSCIKLFAIAWKQRAEHEREGFLERFRGTDRFIAEFLLESLVSAFPAELRDAAGAIAVPDFFNETLIARLTGRDDARQLIARLQRMNLVGSRAEEGSARYRFHPLLRDYLRHQVPRATRATLHRVAADWLSEHGMLERATRHREAAERLDRGGRTADRAGGESAGATAEPEEPAAERGAEVHAPESECPAFSRRELELLQALAHGLRNDEIAEKLFISTGTVKWHLNNIYAKLGAKSRTDAVYKARTAGVIPS